MKIYLVRHGESEANVKRLFCGHTDVDLTEKGKQQAESMARLFENIEVSKIYASPLKRAYKTAMEISKLKNIDVETNDLLKEMYFGAFEGLTWEDIELDYPEESKKFLELGIKYKYKDGESFEDVTKRASEFLSDVNDNTVIVAHGVFIRAMLYSLSFTQYDDYYGYPINNCDVICIEDNNISLLK